jgi:hypothetical protein
MSNKQTFGLKKTAGWREPRRMIHGFVGNPTMKSALFVNASLHWIPEELRGPEHDSSGTILDGS